MNKINEPLPIKNWPLCKKSRKIVEEELGKWLDLFIKQANNQEGNVYRADFVNNDFFYFTDYRDILSKELESESQEQNKKIFGRKRLVMLQLLLKTLLGNVKLLEITCTHCGHKGVWIDALDNGDGHYYYCQKCGKTDICTYPKYYDSTMPSLVRGVAKVCGKDSDLKKED